MVVIILPKRCLKDKICHNVVKTLSKHEICQNAVKTLPKRWQNVMVVKTLSPCGQIMIVVIMLSKRRQNKQYLYLCYQKVMHVAKMWSKRCQSDNCSNLVKTLLKRESCQNVVKTLSKRYCCYNVVERCHYVVKTLSKRCQTVVSLCRGREIITFYVYTTYGNVKIFTFWQRFDSVLTNFMF